MFLSFADPQTADLIGTVLLFSITGAFMLGLWLRLASLYRLWPATISKQFSASLTAFAKGAYAT